MHNLYLYGPPGSGKSTLGRRLAERLSLPFRDLDAAVQERTGKTVAALFAELGEAGFRALEKQALAEASRCERTIVALGGGTLLDPENRAQAEATGRVVCLDCSLAVLRARIDRAPGVRPLVAAQDASEDRLARLMADRAGHYASFPHRLAVADRSSETLLDAAEVAFGSFRVVSGDRPSHIAVGADNLASLAAFAGTHDLGSRAVVVCDTHTADPYGERVCEILKRAGVAVSRHVLAAGEAHKTLAAVSDIWGAFLKAGLGRRDFAVAVGGGVTGDLTGFAAATWMRGIRWLNVPTTLLAMVDASTGGKTGCDLPGGKNLVGAFHAPELVLADVTTLATLNARAWRCGLAETIKHALIADPNMLSHMNAFAALRDADGGATDALPRRPDLWRDVVARSLAVKVHVVRQDPYERGVRAMLNLGHTVGHALETVTDYRIQHGEAVAIGCVEEARLAVRLGLAAADWPPRVADAFACVGLPVALPAGIAFDDLRAVMRRDKKRDGNAVRFALPRAPGDVILKSVEI